MAKKETKNKQINYGAIQTLSLHYLPNFNKKLKDEKKRSFSLSRYIKGGKKSHLHTQLNF